MAISWCDRAGVGRLPRQCAHWLAMTRYFEKVPWEGCSHGIYCILFIQEKQLFAADFFRSNESSGTQWRIEYSSVASRIARGGSPLT